MKKIRKHQADTVAHAYAYYREAGESAEYAIRHARIAVAFFAAGDNSKLDVFHDQDGDVVRLVWEEENEPHDFSYVDTWGLSASRTKKEKRRINDLIEKEGHYFLIAQWRLTPEDEWVGGDGVGDLIGDDYTGYEPDLMKSALDARAQALDEDATVRAAEMGSRATYAGALS